MAIDEQVIKLILDAKGFTETAAGLERSVEAIKAELESLTIAYSKDEVGSDQFVKRTNQLAGELTRQSTLLDALKTAHQGVSTEQGKVTTATASASHGINGYNNALRNLGYGISDVFSNNGPIGQKLMGFSNNVNGIVTGVLQTMGKIGPGAIAAAAVTEIAFTGLGSLITASGIKSMDDIYKIFNKGFESAAEASKTHLEKIKERIKELEDKPIKLAVDMLELKNATAEVERLSAAMAAYKQLMGMQSEAEESSGKKITEAIKEGEGGGPGFEKMLAKQYREEATALDSKLINANKTIDELPAKIAALHASLDIAFIPVQKRMISAELADKYKELNAAKLIASKKPMEIAAQADLNVGDLMSRMTKKSGTEQETAQEEGMRRATAGGREDVARAIALHTPKREKSSKEQEKQDKSDKEMKRLSDQAEKEAAKEKKDAEQDAAWDDRLNDEMLAEMKAVEKKKQLDNAADNRHGARHVKHGSVEDDKMARETVAKVKKQREENYDTVTKNTSIDEIVAAQIAEARARGGMHDQRDGQFREMNPRQQNEAVTNRAQRTLEGHGVSPNESRGMAERMVQEGDKKVTELAIRAADGGVANTQQLIGIAEGLAQLVNQTLMNQRRQGQQIGQLRRHVGHNAETFQNSGGPGG